MKTILIVNPSSSGEYLSNELKLHNIRSIALFNMSHERAKNLIFYKANIFDEQIFVENLTDEKLRELHQQYQFDFILNGAENSVEITDKIATLLLPHLANSPQLSIYQMDKFELNQQLTKHNLPAIKQYRLDLISPEFKPQSFKNMQFPIFIKPLQGVAGFNAACINSYEEFLNYYNALDKQTINNFNKRFGFSESTIFLICEFIVGEEYVVDVFMENGNFHLSSVQKYSIHDVLFTGLEVETDISVITTLENYIREVLKATGLNNGFAHCECFIRQDGTPVIIELNPRISGGYGYINMLAEAEGQASQVRLLANFMKNEPMPKYKPITQRTSRVIVLYNFSNKPIVDFAQILTKRYKTIKQIKQTAAVGAVSNKKPSTLVDAVCLILCSSNNSSLLEAETNDMLRQDLIGW
ncbi:MAG: hypothetical protein RL017_886 [Pseudomonadota bacterium]|jgi:biotin carboxylase